MIVTRAVVDLGGTNVRFARVVNGRAEGVVSLPCDSFPTVEDALRAGLQTLGAPAPRSVALAVAGPVGGDRVTLTNRAWTVDREPLRRTLGLDRLVLLNDFAAVAWAATALGDGDAAHVGDARPGDAGAPRLVLGPGTGLGVALAVPSPCGWTIVPTEGGHATLAAGDAEQAAVLAALGAGRGRVSAERVLSGPGLLHLDAAVRAVRGVGGGAPQVGAITDAARAGDPVADHVIHLFLTWLAAFAGDLALATGARGGVFLGGGVLGHLLPFLDPTGFRAAFDDKAPMSGWMRDVPLLRLTLDEPGLIGAARALDAGGSPATA